MAMTGPYHVNVNCSDLAVSSAFFVDVLGFEPQVRTTPDVQDGAAFGFDAARWDAWILGGAHDGVVLDLLEWKVPTPGALPRKPGDAGFTHLVISIPDPAAIDADHGWITDPDGTAIQLVAGDEVALVGVGVGVADPAATRQLLDNHFVNAKDFFELQPADGNATRAANDLGIFRVAWLTDDIDTDHGALVASGLTELSPPVPLSMGIEGSDISLDASFLVADNGCCFELIAPPAG